MIIHANSIHTGGGKILLDFILSSLPAGEVNYLICDSRYSPPSDITTLPQIYKTKPNLVPRWISEFKLKSISQKNPKTPVLCFANLPPFFRLKSHTILFLQNGLLVTPLNFKELSLNHYLRILYEKLVLKFFMRNVNEVWVQTNWMKTAFEKKFPNKNVKVQKYTPSFPSPSSNAIKKYDFITVTGPEPHKRLLELLTAWEKMPSFVGPSLLVVSSSPSQTIYNQIEKLKNKNITLKVNISRQEIYELYQQSEALILTSKIESFCLPIFEATHFGLEILAPKEKYVMESCKPALFLRVESTKYLCKDIFNYTLRSKKN